MRKIAYIVICGAWISYLVSMLLPGIYGMFGIQATGLSIMSLSMVPQVIFSYITGNTVAEDYDLIDLTWKAMPYGLANLIFYLSLIVIFSRETRVFHIYRYLLFLAIAIVSSIFFVNIINPEDMTDLPHWGKKYSENVHGIGTYVWFSAYIILMSGLYLLERTKFQRE